MQASCFRTCSWTKPRMAAIVSRYTEAQGRGKEPMHWSSSCWLRNLKFSLDEAMKCHKSNTGLHKKQNIHPNSLHIDEMQWEVVVARCRLTEWVSKISMFYHKDTLFWNLEEALNTGNYWRRAWMGDALKPKDAKGRQELKCKHCNTRQKLNNKGV